MCGIFAAYASNDATSNDATSNDATSNDASSDATSEKNRVAREIFFALIALNHRGQEAAGISVSDGKNINYKKDSGMVNQIFREQDLQQLVGHMGIGHTRYSTVGNPDAGRQPYQFANKLGPFSMAHNGEIVGYHRKKTELMADGACFFTDTDSELLAHYLSRSPYDNWEDILADVIEKVPGAYSLVILTNDEIWAIRDPLGLRLLCVGKKVEHGVESWYLASESCCFSVLGAKLECDVPTGTIVRLGQNGLSMKTVKQYPQKTCAFEYVYFARPDSCIEDKYVATVRQNIGRQLALQVAGKIPNGAIVSGVPESANPMAIGFSHQTGIPYLEIFAKNRYIHRTFIKPLNSERKSAVNLKFNPLVENIVGKKILLIDDSIVRGNTIRHLVKMLRDTGAAEIHILVGSPEIRYPCYMGIDMKKREDFIMDYTTPPELAQKIGANSVTFLSIDRLYSAINKKSGLCTACWTGVYPKELDW